MATLPTTPPGDTAEIPSRTIPISHRPTWNHQPKDPSNRRHWNREDGPHTTLRNRHHPDSQDTKTEPPVHTHQLPRIPRQPLHDPQTSPTELHTTIPPARILQRRTTTHTTRPTREQEPTHHTHTRRSRRTDQGRRINQPLQPHQDPGGTPRQTSQTLTNRHHPRTTESGRSRQEHSKHAPTKRDTTRPLHEQPDRINPQRTSGTGLQRRNNIRRSRGIRRRHGSASRRREIRDRTRLASRKIRRHRGVTRGNG